MQPPGTSKDPPSRSTPSVYCLVSASRMIPWLHWSQRKNGSTVSGGCDGPSVVSSIPPRCSLERVPLFARSLAGRVPPKPPTEPRELLEEPKHIKLPQSCVTVMGRWTVTGKTTWCFGDHETSKRGWKRQGLDEDAGWTWTWT